MAFSPSPSNRRSGGHQRMPPRGGRASIFTRAPAAQRWNAAGTAVVLAGLLLLAHNLAPDPRGMGTHEQLGLRPCTFANWTGIPCPTCGMTTAFVLAAQGRVSEALRTQPAGALAAGATALALAGAAMVAATGIRPRRLDLLYAKPALLAAVVAAFLAWLYKIAVILV